MSQFQVRFEFTLCSCSRTLCSVLILDDVRDLQLIVSNQEVSQGKCSDPIELASTQGGTCAFFLYLFRVPIVATINFTTQNCEYLVSNDFLNKPQNRVVVNWPPAGFAGFLRLTGDAEASS